MPRPKVPDDKRQRIAQACDSCKRRKQKVRTFNANSPPSRIIELSPMLHLPPWCFLKYGLLSGSRIWGPRQKDQTEPSCSKLRGPALPMSSVFVVPKPSPDKYEAWDCILGAVSRLHNIPRQGSCVYDKNILPTTAPGHYAQFCVYGH